MKVSYIVPHRNRVELFSCNLESLVAQTASKDSFEVVIADNSSPEQWVLLKQRLQFVKNTGLQVRAYHVDPARCRFSHAPHEYGGMYNPALQQNLAARKATGDVLVLTSPEVVNARTNVSKIQELFKEGKSRFILGWIGDRSLDVVRSNAPGLVRTGFEIGLLKRLCMENSGYGTRCRPEDWKKENYFLGAIKKDDFLRVGGIDEKFQIGIAFEDNEFAERLVLNGIHPEFCGDYAGLHISHSRGYQGDIVSGPNNQIYKQIKGQLVANQGHDWGADSCIVEAFE